MRLLQHNTRKSNGFTIVELVVVISVIAILASISIVGYGAWRTNLANTQVKNDLNAMASAMENYRTFNNGYPTTLPTTVTPSTHVSLTLSSDSSATAYCIDGVSSDNPSGTYYIASESKDQGALSGTCATRPGHTPLGAPTNLAVGITSGSQINLSWTAPSGSPTSYNLKCATNTAFTSNIRTSTSSSTSGTVSSLNSGTTYYCEVSASNSSGTGSWSTAVSATTSAAGLSAPTGVLATTVSTSQINLSWSSISGIFHYNVQQANDSGFTTGLVTWNVNTTSFSFSGLSSGTNYYYHVQAVDANGQTGPWSSAVTGATLSTNLIGWWTFDGNANDSSGNGNNGVVAGASLTTGAKGISNTAYGFIASGTQNIIASIPTVNTNLTLSAWVRPTSYPSERSTIIEGFNPLGYYMSIYTDGSLQNYWYSTSPTGYFSSGASTVPLNQWTYVTATWNGTSSVLYVNGVAKTTTAVTGAGVAATQIYIGSESSARQFVGSIDDVRIYNRGLSLSEIQAIYNAGAQ